MSSSASDPSRRPRAAPPGAVRNNLHPAPSQSPPSRRLSDPRYLDIATSADPLPPPPLPLQPPVGDAFACASEAAVPPSLPDIKPVHRFIPDSVKSFFSRRGRPGGRDSDDVSAPASSDYYPAKSGAPRGFDGSEASDDGWRDGNGAAAPASGIGAASGSAHGAGRDKRGLLPLGAGPAPAAGSIHYDGTWEGPSLSGIPPTTTTTFLTYSQREDEYRARYSYMKSWPGLLRLLGAVQLLLGAVVFACVCAYVHKDNEWFNYFGYGRPSGSMGYGGSSSYYGNYNYDGPKTPFVLVVAGLAWLVTMVLLGVGMSMYYRTILLDSDWWPVTEAAINGVLFLLYLSASIVYVNDLNRGGLCSIQSYNNPLGGAFCRQEGGQVAATIFLFFATFAYLASAAVALKMWRHENARKRRERVAGADDSEMHSYDARPDYAGERVYRGGGVEVDHSPGPMRKPDVRNGHIPSGHIPKPVVVPDYVAKYPPIGSVEERERYKAVFGDQYAEYRELSAELHAAAQRFSHLEELIKRLPTESPSQEEMERVANVFQEYERKKNDPAFVEKKQRCEYLKAKLAHIKQRIQEYDKVMTWRDDL